MVLLKGGSTFVLAVLLSAQALDAGTMVVTDSAAHTGQRGLRFTLGESCATSNQVEVSGRNVEGPESLEACERLTVSDVSVRASGDLSLRSGVTVALGAGFSVDEGGRVAIETAPSLIRDAHLQTDSPSERADLIVRFLVRLDAISLDTSGFVLLEGGGAEATSWFRVGLRRNESLSEDRLFVEARNDDGGVLTTRDSEELVVSSGWHSVEVLWESATPSTSDGRLIATIDGQSVSSLTDLTNSMGRIDSVRLGMDGSGVGASGSVDIDDLELLTVGDQENTSSKLGASMLGDRSLYEESDGRDRAEDRVIPTGPPENDDFANAYELSEGTGRSYGSNQEATVESGEPNHAFVGGVRSVWWRYVAEQPGDVMFETVGSEFNTVLAAYTGYVVSGLDEVVSNNDVSGLGGLSRIRFSATPGVQYSIALDGADGAAGEYELHHESNLVALNCSDDGYEPDDYCFEAQEIDLGRIQTHAACDRDHYRLDAVAGATYEIETFNLAPTSDTTILLWDDTCRSGEALAADGGPGEGELLHWTAPASGSYNVRIVQRSDDYGQGKDYDIVLRCTANCPPQRIFFDDFEAGDLGAWDQQFPSASL